MVEINISKGNVAMEDNGRVLFYCPGCKQYHQVNTIRDNPTYPCWEWNGSLVEPTFKPSILVRRPGDSYICHSFVTDGKIQFLTDCTHELAGQTVDLEVEE